MRRVIPLLGVLLLGSVSCVPREEPTAPEPTPPRVTGNYLLTIQPSAVCRLGFKAYRWGVVATSSGVGVGNTIKATLPGGDSSLELSLSYPPGAATGMVTGSLNIVGNRTPAMGVVVENNIRIFAIGLATGTVSGADLNHGEIRGGFDGPISVSAVGDTARDSMGSCSAADHQWSLTLN
jgi:hypothetical protein